jgi:hypothetical protein
MKNFSLVEAQQKICNALPEQNAQANMVLTHSTFHPFFKEEVVSTSTANFTTVKEMPLVGNQTTRITF